MVTIIDYKPRKNEAGETFFVLILQGGIEMLKAVSTGKFYATARKAAITCTFNEQACKALIGTKLPGKIEKVEAQPYEYVIPGTNEKVTLNYTYLYKADADTVEEQVFQGAL